MCRHEVCDLSRRIDVEHRQRGIDLMIGGDRDDVAVVRVERRLLDAPAPDLDARHVPLTLEPFDDDEVTGRELRQQFIER